MIHRLVRGQVPPKPHTVFEVDGVLTFEHCMTRAGFESIYTIAWHRKPPHWVESEEDLGVHPGWAETLWEGPLRRCHYLTSELPEGRDTLPCSKAHGGQLGYRVVDGSAH